MWMPVICSKFFQFVEKLDNAESYTKETIKFFFLTFEKLFDFKFLK